MTGVSVVTANKGRRPHLARLLEGLGRGAPPCEAIVVEMGGAEAPPHREPFAIRQVELPSEGLPLSAARNAGRRQAAGEMLVFLDVDCIPSANLVEAFDAVLREHDALVCCPVRYLPPGAVSDGWTEEALVRAGRLHPARTFPAEGIVRVAEPGLFWSLAFGIRSTTFDRIGGFDEAFTGYGAEDTDFAFRADRLGIPLLFAGAMQAFHQHHPAYDPPLRHFHDILRNARTFRDRHGVWPMGGWLDAFAAAGLIVADRDRDLMVLRSPSASEIEAARLPSDRVF